MADNSFSKFVPGFEFLQGLVKNAGTALPGIGQWVAPTLNPDELQKRIDELRTVQFWLEQNASMIGTTIQALEVQRMTLSTLKTMNVPLAELSEALKVPEAVAEPALRAAKAGSARAAKTAKTAAKVAATAATNAAVDPMQWWSALGQQFTQLASNAMKDQAADAAKHLAGAATGAAAKSLRPKASASAATKRAAPRRR